LTSEFFGSKFKKNYREFCLYYKLYINKTSYLLQSIGVNINTSPVLDLRIKGASNVIGDRAFSNDPKVVSKIGDYCINYYHQDKIGTVIKHIPGHGLANVDSHHFTPIVKKKLSYLLKKDFLAFKNKKAFFAMTGHIIFSKIDKENTVTHSKKLIRLIREKIKFKNIIISDDLSMKSLKSSLEENTIKTFKAGCNLALHCNGNLNEMTTVGKNSPIINKFIIKKTSQFYKILS
jgi:beta-N-acetylhexosaminidase